MARLEGVHCIVQFHKRNEATPSNQDTFPRVARLEEVAVYKTVLSNTHLHIDLVILPEDEIASSKGCDESEDGVVPARQLAKHQCDGLVDCGQQCEIAGMLEGSLGNEFELLVQTGRKRGVQF